ncbi:MAG: hypothetical protein GF388_09340 [Candidatus Aegiribacteria sp.]|nr:hypothetical protein [Candidatus Aegiribacteria sp.]MBD3295260.1 hypothetical protein [Candidatus Fermentibacteria bacterium]
MLLAGATTEEVEEYLKYSSTVLIPVGSLEQHWKAAPLACDTIIPVRLCEAAGRKTSAAVTPAITFGSSENHMEFAGTVSLKPQTLASLARDISESLYTHGFRNILFLSGHGGNRAPIKSGLVEAAASCPDADLRYLLYRNLSGAEDKQRKLFCPDPGYHVTVTEVSMVWHLMGEKIPNFPQKEFPPEPPSGAVLSRRKWKQTYPEGGAGSNLKYVSAEKGEIFFDYLVERLCAYIHSMNKCN